MPGAPGSGLQSTSRELPPQAQGTTYPRNTTSWQQGKESPAEREDGVDERTAWQDEPAVARPLAVDGKHSTAISEDSTATHIWNVNLHDGTVGQEVPLRDGAECGALSVAPRALSCGHGYLGSSSESHQHHWQLATPSPALLVVDV
ncbi:hypothetical protein GSI_11398 [Ganoderma sinense ZZ0214-1]|uniref:Uncharacterized protein n=1 Tax=Ganoderma sinense ZZ0214-1 TaxID=1077348 RepID=A0A2G8RVW4_9APHY|nr:hypothetical protein GSI_11398 [Ganoderma sinense ZZ0214-1]